jgi:hypothetical protein
MLNAVEPGFLVFRVFSIPHWICVTLLNFRVGFYVVGLVCAPGTCPCGNDTILLRPEVGKLLVVLCRSNVAESHSLPT